MTQSSRQYFFILLQVVLWSGFVVLPYFTVPFHLTPEATKDVAAFNPANQPDWREVLLFASLPFNLTLILFFYLHHFFFFDAFAVRGKFARYVLIIVASFLVILAVAYYSRKGLFPSLPFFLLNMSARDFVRYLTWFMLVWLISLGIKLSAQWIRAERRAEAIETEHLRSELSMLHAQINPHFLFNSLNTVYSLSLKKSDATPVAVLKLSQLLRYMIEDASREKIALEQEVNYLNNYIEMQKLRTSPLTKIDFQIKGDISSASISPLLFLSFVENAFKYGISNSEPSEIAITLEQGEADLFFSVINKKFEQIGKPSTGIGINNVQRRLELLYPGRYNLQIDDTEDLYSVKLNIQTI